MHLTIYGQHLPSVSIEYCDIVMVTIYHDNYH